MPSRGERAPRCRSVLLWMGLEGPVKLAARLQIPCLYPRLPDGAFGALGQYGGEYFSWKSGHRPPHLV